jgi:homoserine kinase type II
LNAVTEIQQPSLEEALSRYDIGRLVRYWQATNGIENSNYFIETDRDGQTQDFVFTIMEQAANAGPAYVPMMSALYDGGLPVAPPLCNMADLPLEEVAGKPAMLQQRLSGQHVYNPTVKQVSALARFIARMHLTMHRTEIVLPNYPRDEVWLADRAAMTKGYVPYSDQALLDASLAKTQSLLARADVQAMPSGMIHGDLFRDNVLFNEYGLTGVLDFHHAACGYWIYDLAVVANDWCNDASGRLDPERTTAMLRAYHHIRPLTDSELWFFSAFTLYAALAFWMSRLAVALDQKTAGSVRFKNPDDFKRIVQHHAAHQFYVDPRHLTL